MAASVTKSRAPDDCSDVSLMDVDQLRANLLETRRKLRRVEHLVHTIGDNAPVLIAQIDASLCFQSANQAYAQRFKMEVADLLGRPVAEVIGQSNFRKLKPRMDEALAGERVVFGVELDLPDQRESVIKEVTYTPEWDDSGAVVGFHVVGVDVTEQRRSTHTLADREEKLATVTHRMSLAMESAGMGSFEWDPITDRAVWDDQHLAITGLEGHAETYGQLFFDRIHPEDLAVNRQRIDRAVATGGDYSGEFRFIRPDGEVRWLAARSRMVRTSDGNDRLVGLTWDITDQKHSMERFRLAEARLRLAAEAAGFGTYEIDLVSGETRWSAEFKRLVGVDDDADQDLAPGEVADFVHPDDRAMVARQLTRARRGFDGGTHSFAHRIILPNGDVRWVRRRGQTVLSNSGRRPIQVIGTLLDITAQKQIEQSLEEARRVAEQANESKSEFLANMSHEIRTPMSAIMGYTEILSRQLTDPDDLKCASIIRHNGRFLLDIINDILDISKIEAGKLEVMKNRFRPDQLVADVRSLMSIRAAEKSIPLEVCFEGEIPKTIRSDRKRLKQILVNLIGNAIKFTRVGSVQLIVRFLYVDEVPKLQFEIIDTGIGLSEAQLDKLFQPFTQGDSSVVRKFEGTGLGLSISQRLAGMLGGGITVQSELHSGSTFTLTIQTGSVKNVPMIVPKPDAPECLSAVPFESQVKICGKILVVDDRRDMVFLAQRLIEEAGGTVEAAENGSLAIKKISQAERRGQPFDLITMDMQMPVLDGYEATRRLRESGFTKPIVAITAHAMEGDRQRCLDAGCTDYITKPLDGPKLIEVLANYLDFNVHGNTNKSENLIGILIIDDSHDSAESLKMLLEFNGHRVVVADSGTRGIETARTFQPDVILLDLSLPDISGFDVLKQLKTLDCLQHTAFLAATGSSNESETLAAGFDHHMTKPLNVTMLEKWIESVTKAKPGLNHIQSRRKSS